MATPALHAIEETPTQPSQREPSKVPPNFDPSRYPHYSVQSTIFSLLLSALNMSEHYERFPGAEERQRLLDRLVYEYQQTCEPVTIKSQ